MLRYAFIAAFLFVTFVASSTPTENSRCPTGCNCTEISASCDTLNVPTFHQEVLTLKIVHPKEPLILKNGVFKILGLQLLNSIQIEDATILEMDKSGFEDMPRLSSLEIINSNVIDNKEVFSSIPKLHKVRLSKNTIQQPLTIKSKSIQELEMSDCGLYEITNETFANVPQLTYLNVANNHIHHVHKNAFKELITLEEIILSDNNISKLPVHLFEQNSNLFTIDISNNPINSFDIDWNSDLEKLVLKSCNLQSFNGSLEYYDGLSHLDLSDNKIMSSSKLNFENLDALEFINLSNNSLNEIPDSIFKENYNLLKIILDNNRFGSLPSFKCRDGYYFKTYSFSCKNCDLTSLLDDTFINLRALVILDLSHNRLQGHNLRALQDLPSLIEIDLSYNNISIIAPRTFQHASSLEKLILANNPIKVFDTSVIHQNKALKGLDLSGCQLRHLWQNWLNEEISSLRNLNIANNQLTTITTAELDVVGRLEVLDVSNNPLRCTKDIRDTIKWLTNHDVVPSYLSQKKETHESLDLEASSFESLETKSSSWKMLAETACSEEYYTDIDDNEEEEDDDDDDDSDEDVVAEVNSVNDDITVGEQNEDSEDDDDYYEDDNLMAERIRQVEKILRHDHYTMLWPSIVFVFTALLVLLIAANLMLLFLKKRQGNSPRHMNLPHIKIPQWNPSKIKKHSGSIYQPLTEDNCDLASITSSRHQIENHFPSVHNSV